MKALKILLNATVYSRLTPTSSWWTGALELETGNITKCVPILESSEQRLRGEAKTDNFM